MTKALVFAAFAASCLAAFPFSEVSAQAPKGGFKRCLKAGNTPAICEQRRRDLDAGLIVPDCNFGNGEFKAPKIIKGKYKCRR